MPTITSAVGLKNYIPYFLFYFLWGTSLFFGTYPWGTIGEEGTIREWGTRLIFGKISKKLSLYLVIDFILRIKLSLLYVDTHYSSNSMA